MTENDSEKGNPETGIFTCPALSFCSLPLFLSPRVAYFSSNDRQNPTTDLRPNSNSSLHDDAAKNPRMAKTALGTADVKNDYKSTCGIC